MMVIYFLPIFFVLFLAFVPSSFRNVAGTILMLFLIIFAGFRGLGIDKDAANYYYGWFVTVRDYTLSGDPLSNLIFTINRFYSKTDMRLSLLIFSFIGVSLKFFFFLKVSRVVWISLLVYYSYFFFVFEMTQVRAGVALAFSLLSVYFYGQKRVDYFLLCSIAAFLFHSSSLIVFVVIILGIERWNALALLCVGLSVYFTSLLGLSMLGWIGNVVPSVLTNRLNDYLAAGSVANILNPFSLTYLLICSYMLLVLFKKPNHFTKTEALCIRLSFVSFICLGLLKDSIHLSFRVYDIFLHFLPITISLFATRFRPRFICYAVVLSISLVSVFNQIYYIKAFKEYEMTYLADKISGFEFTD